MTRARWIILALGLVAGLGILFVTLILPSDLLTPEGYSTPEACIKTYHNAVRSHRWTAASRCFTKAFRERFEAPIEDRRFFDCYSGRGFRTLGFEIIPFGYVSVLSQTMAKASIRITSANPYVPRIVNRHLGLQHYTCRIPLEQEDGEWKIGAPSLRSDFFAHYYDTVVAEKSKGWAKRVEVE